MTSSVLTFFVYSTSEGLKDFIHLVNFEYISSLWEFDWFSLISKRSQGYVTYILKVPSFPLTILISYWFRTPDPSSRANAKTNNHNTSLYFENNYLNMIHGTYDVFRRGCVGYFNECFCYLGYTLQKPDVHNNG